MPKRSRTITVAGLVIICLGMGLKEAYAQSFQRSTVTAELVDVFSSAVGDFDGDGDTDIAATAFTGNWGWLETLPNRTRVFRPMYLTTGYLRNIVAADINHDRYTDLVVAAYTVGRVFTLTPRFVQGVLQFDSVSIGGFGGPFDVRTADLNQDGQVELLVADYAGNTLRIFAWSNDNWSELAGLGGIYHIWDIDVVDYDHDGDLDAVTGSDAYGGSNYALSWFEQVNLTTWVRHILRGQGASMFVSAGDVDGDDDVDLVISDARDSTIALLRRTGENLTAVTLTTNYARARNIELHDLNQDGRLDVAAIGGEGQVTWWRQNDTGQFIINALDANFQCLGLTIADVDQDGDPDMLVAETQQDQLQLYTNLIGIPALIRGSVSAALNDDAVSDAVIRIRETGVSAWSDHFGNFRLATIPGTFTLEVSHICHEPVVIPDVSCVQGDSTEQNVEMLRPDIHIEISSLNVVVPNGLVSTYSIPLTNEGDGPLEITSAITGNMPQDLWLSVSPPQLIVAPFSQDELFVHLSPDTSNSANWDYQGFITLYTNSCPDTMLTIAVSAYILDAPEQTHPVAETFALRSVYPNPFNETARVEFSLPTDQDVRLALYDLTGREARVVHAGRLAAGPHQLELSGRGLAAGIYLLRLAGARESATQKIVLLK